ncbi:MAG: hypothetical protein IIB19_05555 [Chloroflexi bacterium]|nr:hypothetical protein [Chloroflexota bacterium]
MLIFGTLAVGAMLVMYTLEERSHWFVLGFAAASAIAALYGGLIAAWPFAALEGVWSLVALRRWWRRYRNEERQSWQLTTDEAIERSQ